MLDLKKIDWTNVISWILTIILICVVVWAKFSNVYCPKPVVEIIRICDNSTQGLWNNMTINLTGLI